KFHDGKIFRPLRLGDGGGGQQRGRIRGQATQALAQHLAPLAEGGGNDALQQKGVGRRQGTGPRRQFHQARSHLGRRREGARRNVEEPPRLTAPLGGDGQPAI